MLAAAVQVVLTADPVAAPVRRRFRHVIVQDCTPSALPAALAEPWPGGGGSRPTSGAAALKVGVRRDRVTGRRDGPHGEPGRTNDRATLVARLPLEPGALRLADLGFFSLAELAEHDAGGRFWRSRLRAGTARFTPDGQRQDLLTLRETGARPDLDQPVLGGTTQRLACRLLAVRVPQAVADQRRRRLRATARRTGQPVSMTRVARRDGTALLTTVPPDRLTLREALARLRARWQMELLFTLWKCHQPVDAWRTTTPWRILTDVYAKLLAAIVQQWLTLAAGGVIPTVVSSKPPRRSTPMPSIWPL